MTENRNGKGWTDWCNPSDSEKSDEKPPRSRRRDDDDNEDGGRYRDRRDDRQGHRRFRADEERQINGKKYSMDRPRNGDRVLYSTTMMAGPQAYSVQVMYKPVDVADNVIIWDKGAPPEFKRVIGNSHLHPGFTVKQHAGMATANKRLIVTLQKSKPVEDHQVNGFMQIFDESSFRFTDNGSQVQGPADRGNFRGRGRGLRRRGWGPRWNPCSGSPVMSMPYGYVQPYTQVVPRQPTVTNVMRHPFQTPTAGQPFQLQPWNAMTSSVTPQMNHAGTRNGIVCSYSGRCHDNHGCPASAALCYRCNSTVHFARCCSVASPQ